MSDENQSTVELVEFTIKDLTLKIEAPYEEGHQISAGEASALNQLLRENTRNNLAKKVEELMDKNEWTVEEVRSDPEKLAQFQTIVDTYVEKYEFGERSGGGRISDPVEAKAMERAREVVRSKIVETGFKVSEYKASEISALAKQVLDGPLGEGIREKARADVEETRKLAEASIDIPLIRKDKPKAEAEEAQPDAE